MRRALLIVLLASAGCGNKTGSALGGLELHIHYSISTPDGGCVRVQAVPETGSAMTLDLPLAGKPRDGGLVVAIAPLPGWSAVDIPASLHHADDCRAPSVASETLNETFPDGHTVRRIDVALIEGMTGAGGGAAGGGAAGGGAAGGGTAGGSGTAGGGTAGGSGTAGGGTAGGGTAGGGAAGGSGTAGGGTAGGGTAGGGTAGGGTAGGGTAGGGRAGGGAAGGGVAGGGVAGGGVAGGGVAGGGVAGGGVAGGGTAGGGTAGAPAGVTAGLELWYRADRGTVLATGSEVGTWQDQSGNGRDATGAMGTRPARVASNPEVGGMPTVRFTDDELPFDGSFMAGTAYTVFTVAGRNGTNAGNFYMSGSSQTMNANFLVGPESSTQLRLSQYTNDLNATIPAKGAGREWNLEVFSLNLASGHEIRRNGASVATNNNTNTLASWAGSRLGYFSPFTIYYDGDLAEIVMYSRFLTCAERRAIEAELALRWSLTWSAPPCP